MIKLMALDVDGVVRDSSTLVYECYRIGLDEIGLGKRFLEEFTVKDLWHFKGLGRLNSKRESIKAIAVLLNIENKPRIYDMIKRQDAEAFIWNLVSMNSEKCPDDETVDGMVDAYADMFESEDAEKLVRIYPDVEETINKVHAAGKEISIVTNSGINSVKRDVPDSIISLCSNIITPKDVTMAKPSGEGLKLLSERSGVIPEGIIYLGDAVIDIRAAKDAGCISGALLCGMGLKKHLEMESPDHIFKDMNEAGEWITNN